MLSCSSKSSCCLAHLMISSASFTPHSLPLCRLTFSSLPPRTQPHCRSHGHASAVGRPWVVSIIDASSFIFCRTPFHKNTSVCVFLDYYQVSTTHSSVLSLPNSCRTRHIVFLRISFPEMSPPLQHNSKEGHILDVPLRRLEMQQKYILLTDYRYGWSCPANTREPRRWRVPAGAYFEV
jgi:hypothetical protein